MTREEAITEYIVPAINRTWNEKVCKKILEALQQEPCEDAISRQAAIEMAYDMSEIDGEHFTKPCMVVNVEDIQKLPPVTPKHTDAEIQKMQEMEQAEIQKAYELGKAEVQPSEDCISRQAALDCFTATKLKKFDFILYAREELKKLPSVNPQKAVDWIPVNSGILPKPYEKVLVTKEMFHWANEPVEYTVDLKSFNGIVDFVAWMPFYQEPYEVESEVKE